MNREKWEQVKMIFNSALELSPDERLQYLERACGPDTDIREAVDELISSYRTSFLDNGFLRDGSVSERDTLTPGSSLRHYEILRLLGEGGMGCVYLAYDQRLARKVAIKVFSSNVSHNRDQLDRFIREARAASALHHPNICTVYEIDPEHDPPYIAMEYVEGRSLADVIANQTIGAEQAIDIVIQAAEGLAEAHAAGIVHRDIKPANIVINKSGVAKLVDFGIAKKILASADDMTERQLSSAGMIVGTISYMSPEQARGKEVDARSDIWSLGVILHELLTGELPFKGETPGDVISEILKSDPPTYKNLDSPMSAEIDRALRKALAKDKDERFSSARRFIDELKRIKTGLDQAASLHRSENGKTTLIQSEQTSDTAPAITRKISQHFRQKPSYFILGLLVIISAAFGMSYFFRPTAPIDSLAVMPFVNETGNPDSEYLSDGITESLIGRLSQIPNLSVKARSSVFRFKGKDVGVKDIGKELSVPGILMGRLARHGKEYSLYIELVDAVTEKVIWQAEYTRPESSLVTIPSEIARDVANKLQQKLSTEAEQSITRNYTNNSAAYELYLKGRYYWDKRNEESYKVAEDAYKQAIALDPNYALAYAGLADLYLFREADIARAVAMPRAKQYALKALEIDETLAEAHNTLAFVNENYDFDMPAAEAGFKRAIELKPNYAIARQFYGGYLVQTGRTEEGLSEVRKALELEPYSAAINWHYGLMLTFARRYDDAIAQEQRTLQLQPNYRLAEGALIGAYIQAGRLDDASALVQKHIEAGNNPEARLRMARIRLLSGDRAEGERILTQVLNENPEGRINSYSVAIVYATLGDKDKTIEWLNRGYDQRVFSMFFLRVDPVFDGVRDDPRFQDLLRRIGLIS